MVEEVGTSMIFEGKVVKAKAHIEERLKSYEETEEVIHDWIREMKNPYALIHNSSVLEKNKEYILSIINE